MYDPLPPDGVIFIDPSLAFLQLILKFPANNDTDELNVIACGSLKVYTLVSEQPFWSVTTTV